jgi:NAD(P)-dependent dehydrogenase (short-subunit alcohol dehydrogenase family)
MRHIRVEKLWRKARFRDDQHRHISNAVLFLASDESRYITGVSLPVDAGGLLK